MAQVRVFIALAAISTIIVTLGGRQSAEAQKQPEHASAPQTTAENQQSVEDQVRAALEEPCKLRFMQKSLSEFAGLVADTYGINVAVDRDALEALGYSADDPVELHIANVSLRSALSMLLEPLELTWIIRNETLIITSREQADYHLLTRVYEVRDLVEIDDNSDPAKLPMIYSKHEPATEFEPLMNVIMSTVAVDTWDEVGGPGSMKPLRYGDKMVIIVSQTEQIHDRIAALLDSLRRVPPHQVAADKPEPRDNADVQARDETFVQVYPISISARATDEQIEELVRVSIGDESWLEGTFVRGVASTIIVRHNVQVHRRVYELLTGVGAIEPIYSDIWGGGLRNVIPVVGGRDKGLPPR